MEAELQSTNDQSEDSVKSVAFCGFWTTSLTESRDSLHHETYQLLDIKYLLVSTTSSPPKPCFSHNTGLIKDIGHTTGLIIYPLPGTHDIHKKVIYVGSPSHSGCNRGFLLKFF